MGGVGSVTKWMRIICVKAAYCLPRLGVGESLKHLRTNRPSSSAHSPLDIAQVKNDGSGCRDTWL